MRKLLWSALVLLLVIAITAPAHAASAITRRDGYLLLWESVRRPVEPSSEKRFTDVPKGAPGEPEITYGKYRGMIDDEATEFHPDDSLQAFDALLWLFRTRNIDEDGLFDPDGGTVVPVIAERVGLGRYVHQPDDQPMIKNMTVTSDDVVGMIRLLDAFLVDEVHETSLYAEKFHGKGTAFGEAFDMNSLTAAHRTFPKNTLVEVTNIENGKKVTVRINDRGPYVKGRDMDLSLAAFTTIADRSKGKIHVRFRRLGDAGMIQEASCGESLRAVRLGRRTRLDGGFPSTLPLGGAISTGASDGFVVRSVTYPDGNVERLEQWFVKGERYQITPSMPGRYVFKLSSKDGVTRQFAVQVSDCAS